MGRFSLVNAALVVCVLGSSVLAQLSPTAVVSDSKGERLYVAEFDAARVAVLNLADNKVLSEIKFSEKPTGIAMSPDGRMLYIAGGAAQGKVAVVNIAAGKVVKRIDVGHTPMSPIVSPDGSTLYVCNRFNNDVSVIDLAKKKEIAKIAVVRQPIAGAITPDGKSLFVVNMLPAGASDGDYAAAAVSVIDTATNKVTTVQLLNGSIDALGVCVSPDGKYAYVTHVLARYQLPTTQLERGWVNTNALSVIDVASKKLVNTVLLDDVDLGAANPWGVVCTTDGKYVCVALAGTHEICVVDRGALHEKLDKVARGERVSEVSSAVDDVPNDLSFLVGSKKRIKLKGNGPRGIAAVGSKIYATEYFTDSIGIIDVNDQRRDRSITVALGPKTAMSQVRKGEMLFNDATMCFQHWQSCASCHPGQGRADGVNWDLLNDGLGNPKNTKSLLLAHSTPPSMSRGVRDSAEVGVRAGIRYILFAVRPEEDANALDEYLKSLKPVDSPYLENGKLSRAAKRGKDLFDEAKCAKCHSGEYYTDMKLYNVATGKGREADIKFDTVTLSEVWQTAPYLHDGRAATIEEVLTKYNIGDKHGVTSDLTAKEISDLAAYVLSL